MNMGDVIEIYPFAGKITKNGETIAVLQSEEYMAKLDALSSNIQAAKEALNASTQEYLIAKESLPLNVKKAFALVLIE